MRLGGNGVCPCELGRLLVSVSWVASPQGHIHVVRTSNSERFRSGRLFRCSGDLHS